MQAQTPSLHLEQHHQPESQLQPLHQRSELVPGFLLPDVKPFEAAWDATLGSVHQDQPLPSSKTLLSSLLPLAVQ
jgi:hypothetical protein